MRRLLLIVLLVLAVLLAVNTIVADNETKPAKADIGRILELPEGDLQVREDGPRDKPTIVFLHGFAGSMHWWTDLVERLKDDFRLVRIDLLGHGGSQKPGSGYSMEHQARQVALALNTLRIQHAVIAGHSMGGIVATAITELDPSLIDGIVLIGTPANKDASELPFLARLGFVPVIGEAIQRLATDGMIKSNLEKAFYGDFDVPDQFVDDFNKMTYTSYDSSHNEASDYNDATPVSERLAKFDKPLLVIQGAEDDFVDPESARDYKDANIVFFPATGHTPMVERPDETARLVKPFVINNTRGPADRAPRKSKVQRNQ
jgi:pimeloyl-ACP methyl ester carboxylesterase